MEYLTKSNSKFLLQFKDIFTQIQEVQNFNIETMEIDKNHIHLLVRAEPKISPLKVVKILKEASTIFLWKNYEKQLQKEFLKEHTFWSDGYFVSTIGNVSEETLRRYTEEQG